MRKLKNTAGIMAKEQNIKRGYVTEIQKHLLEFMCIWIKTKKDSFIF